MGLGVGFELVGLSFQGLRFVDKGLGPRVEGLRYGVQGWGLRGWGLRFRV